MVAQSRSTRYGRGDGRYVSLICTRDCSFVDLLARFASENAKMGIYHGLDEESRRFSRFERRRKKLRQNHLFFAFPDVVFLPRTVSLSFLSHGLEQRRTEQ